MRSFTKLTQIVILAAVVTFCMSFNCLAAKKAAPVESNEPNVMAFPYIAEITEENVNIRSGPGTNFYSCGRLNKADRIEVAGTQLSWSKIVPPPSCFAWISKQYVAADANQTNVGIVNANTVRVYAGSEALKPIHSTTVLVKLNRGDKVALLGQEEGDYLKIAPPPGSFLWISTNYAKAIGPVATVGHPMPPAPAVVPTTLSGEAKKLEEYYALEKQLKAEKEKPVEAQNFETLKKAFAEMAANKDNGKAARYAEVAVKQIEQCELAKLVGKESELQDSQYQQVRQQIEKARAAKLAQLKDMSKFATIGQLQSSNIYSGGQTKRYRIVDESTGKTLCYAEPVGAIGGADLTKLIGKQVGLVGEIEPLPHISGVLVKFTEIVEMK